MRLLRSRRRVICEVALLRQYDWETPQAAIRGSRGSGGHCKEARTWMVMDRLSMGPTPSRMTVSSTGQDHASLPQVAPAGPPGVPLYMALRKPLYWSPCRRQHARLSTSDPPWWPRHRRYVAQPHAACKPSQHCHSCSCAVPCGQQAQQACLLHACCSAEAGSNTMLLPPMGHPLTKYAISNTGHNTYKRINKWDRTLNWWS